MGSKGHGPWRVRAAPGLRWAWRAATKRAQYRRKETSGKAARLMSGSSQTVPHRAVITVCVMMGNLMQALDSSIANVSLPYMQGTLSTSSDEITWVLTSYVIAA